MQKSQNEFDAVKSWIHFSEAPNLLFHRLASQAFDFINKRTNNVAPLHSVSDWKKRQKLIRKTLLDIVGPFLAKTPMNPGITGTIVKDGYKVEIIIYRIRSIEFNES